MSELKGDNISLLSEDRGKVVLFFPTPGIEQDVWFPFPYLYIGPFLEKNGYRVKIIDARVDIGWEKVLVNELKDCVAVGITAMSSPDLISASKASNIVRKESPDTVIAWGGHHASDLPEQILDEGVADYVFIGPSELTFPQVLTQVLNGKAIDPSIKGILWKDELGNIEGNREVNVPIFDYQIAPGYHLLDIEKYRSKNNVVSYFKTRGCPFKCTFCATGVFDTSDRTKKQYHSEIRYLIDDLRFKNIVFRDPTFFLAKKTVLDVARLMKDLGDDVFWKGQARATSMQMYTNSELQLLKDSGLKSIMFGIESGSQRMLDIMEKRIKVKNIYESAAICGDYDIEFYGSFMFAMPRETINDLRNTIKVMDKVSVTNNKALLQNSIFVPLPGTPMYSDAVSMGYQPPKTLKEWGSRPMSSDFNERNDIVWFEPDILEEYKKVYLERWPSYKHAYEREKGGDYVNPMGKR